MASKQSIATLLMIAGFLVACTKQSGFMEQDRTPEASVSPTTAVATIVKDGAFIGNFSADSKETQVLRIDDDTALGGVELAVPAGSLAINVGITIKVGETIADSSTLQSLAINNEVTAVSTTVSITPSIAIDAQTPFTVSIPLPESSSLNLTDTATLAKNLVVFYKVDKASDGNTYNGILSASELQVVGSVVKFSTMYFGSYQAAYLKEELAAPVESVIPEAPLLPVHRYYVSGFASVSFGSSISHKSQNDSAGNMGWMHPYNPASIVKPDYILTTGYRSYESAED